jgi:damage-control phosphatase, subfamily I
MKTYLECLPCTIRQALEAVSRATTDDTQREEVLRRAALAISSFDLSKSSPVLIGTIHRIVREVTGQDDPYREAKETCNRNAMLLYPEMKQMTRQSPNPLETALRLAIAGNVIDFVVHPNADRSDIHEALQDAFAAVIDPQTFNNFRQAVKDARKILYLGDNAGEIVFDRLLIEELPFGKTSYAVKGTPVVNDVTVVDAEYCGMTEVVNVISNGSSMPGTILADCSDLFRDKFREADLVISKGQGNFESLEGMDKNIFFLFKSKCNVITTHLGYEIGRLVALGNRWIDQNPDQSR